MPTERETYYLSYLAALIGLSRQTKRCRDLGERDKFVGIYFLDFVDESFKALHELQSENWFQKKAEIHCN
jgi:hypothetical protein